MKLAFFPCGGQATLKQVGGLEGYPKGGVDTHKVYPFKKLSLAARFLRGRDHSPLLTARLKDYFGGGWTRCGHDWTRYKAHLDTLWTFLLSANLSRISFVNR